MTEVSFYQLNFTPVEKTLPKLMEKVAESKTNAIIYCADEQLVEKYNDILWSYSTKTFLPHGSKLDDFAEEQPIYLTASDENPNQAKIIVIVNTTETKEIKHFERCLDVFDGTNPELLAVAEERLSHYKKFGFKVRYWQQKENGGWEEKPI